MHDALSGKAWCAEHLYQEFQKSAFCCSSTSDPWNYLTVQLNRTSNDSLGDPDLYGWFHQTDGKVVFYALRTFVCFLVAVGICMRLPISSVSRPFLLEILYSTKTTRMPKLTDHMSCEALLRRKCEVWPGMAGPARHRIAHVSELWRSSAKQILAAMHTQWSYQVQMSQFA